MRPRRWSLPLRKKMRRRLDRSTSSDITSEGCAESTECDPLWKICPLQCEGEGEGEGEKEEKRGRENGGER